MNPEEQLEELKENAARMFEDMNRSMDEILMRAEKLIHNIKKIQEAK